MPWSCKTCQAVVPDDVSADCPACGAKKTHWTLVQNQTRTLRVGAGGKRFTTERAEDAAVRVASEGAYDDVAWASTTEVPALPRSVARDLIASGRGPAPADLLCVRQFPGAASPTEVELTPLLSAGRADAASFAAGAEAPHDARFLLVFGEPVEVPELPGVQLLDVTDDTPEGHAAKLQVKALGRPARTVDVRARIPVVRALLTGMFFDTDKALLLPSAMKGIRNLRRYYEQNPSLQMLVVGHADTAGSAEHNLPLSAERASAVTAYLRDDVEHWAGYFQASRGVSQPWGTREVQWMLSALPREGPPFYPGEPTGVNDPTTTEAVRRFQVWSNQTRGTTLDEDGAAGPLTRRELVAAYMELDGTTLPATVVLLEHGCGEFHPEVPTGDGVSAEENRRVEIFLFHRIEPLPQTPCPAPGCPEYPEWRRRTILTLDLTLEPGSLQVDVKDEVSGAPLVEADVRIAGIEARAGKTDGAGTARFDELFPGPYDLLGEKAGFEARRLVVDVPPGGTQAKSAPPPGDDAKQSFAQGASPAGEPAAEGEGADADGAPSRLVDLTLQAQQPEVTFLRGLKELPVPVEAGYGGQTFRAGARWSILHRDHARTLTLDRKLPAPFEVLRLDARPGAATDRTITVRVPLRTGSPRVTTLSVADRPLTDGRLTLDLVCVYGKAEAGPAEVADAKQVTPIDVSDPQPDGTEDVARALEVEAFGLPPQRLELDVRRPRIVKLVAFAVPPKAPRYDERAPKGVEAGPSARVVVHHGWTVRLEWTALGPFDALSLEPKGQVVATGGKEDPGKATTGKCDVDPATDPIGRGGVLSLETRRIAVPSHQASVQVVGITRFTLRSKDPEEHPLAAYDPKSGAYTDVPQLEGRAGTFRKFPAGPGLLALGGERDLPGDSPEETRRKAERKRLLDLVWFGTVRDVLYPWVQLEWTVVGPEDLQVELDLPGLDEPPTPGALPGSTHWDVGPATFADGGQGGREVRVKRRAEHRTAAFLEADLSVWEKGKKRESQERLTSSVLRLRIDRRLPELEAFSVKDRDATLAEGGKTSAWSNLGFPWAVKGDHVGNRVRLSVFEAGAWSEPADSVGSTGALHELDLKARGDHAASGRAPAGPLPKALEGKARLLLVVELVRPATPAEKASLGADWMLSATGPAGRRTQTIEVATALRTGRFPCLAMDERCPVNDAIDLHRSYLTALEALEETYRWYAEGLNAAHFVRAACDQAIEGREPVSESAVADALHEKHAHGQPAGILGASQLYADIQEWQAQIKRAQDIAEARAQTLIFFITSDVRSHDNRTFQEHLCLEAHTGHSIDDDHVQEALALYGIEDAASVPEDEARLRVGNQTAHALALLTASLDATSNGRTFLRQVIVNASQAVDDPTAFHKDYLAFDNVWEHVSKANNALSEPIGKLLFNTLSVGLRSLWDLSDSDLNLVLAQKSFDAAVKGGDAAHFSRALAYFGASNAAPGGPRLGDDVLDQIFERTASPEIKKFYAETGRGMRDEQRVWTRLREISGDEARAINGTPCAWITAFIDAVALGLTLRKAAVEMRTEPLKTGLALAKDLFGLLKSGLELREAYALRREAVVLTEAVDDAAKMAAVAKPGKLLRHSKFICGAVAGLASAGLAFIDYRTALDQKDWARAGFSSVLVFSSLIGIMFPLFGSLVAFVTWIAMELFLDPPIVDWLETTPWGVRPTMPISKTISSFYAKFYDISIHVHIGHDSNHDAIEVWSNLLADEAQVTMALGPKAHEATPVAIDLRQDAVDGKGLIEWPMPTTLTGKQRFRLYRPWEVFGVPRGKEYEVKVAIEVDMSADGPELEKLETGVELRPPPAPALLDGRGFVWGFAPGVLRQRKGAHPGDPWFLPVDAEDQRVTVRVGTRYAHGLKVDLELTQSGIVGTRTPRVVGSAPIDDRTPGRTGAVHVVLELPMWLPDDDEDGYGFKLEARLLEGDETISTTWTAELRAARSRHL